MRGQSESVGARSLNAFLVILVIVTLFALAWGISTSNATAATIAGAGLAVLIMVFGTMNLVPDNMRSEDTERMLHVASNTLEYLRGGLTAENANAICEMLLPETGAAGIAITDAQRVLAYAGEYRNAVPAGQPNTAPTLEVLESGRLETFMSIDSDGTRVRHLVPDAATRASTFGIIVPLVVRDRAVGTIKLYYRHASEIDRTQLAIAAGFAQLLSTQLAAFELDRQAELTARAEVKALQAQINPHFLFNTLNTIASLTRTDPTRARELLRDFSAFYRAMLENSESLIPLRRELDQTWRYLTIEKARFGEDRIIENEQVEPGCEALRVPAFLVQPIVENAVRHAMRDDGPLHVDVYVATDGDDILVAVADDGLGMEPEVARRLLEPQEGMSSNEKGTGIALRNVAERVERFFGEGSDVEVVSKLGEGTCVTLKLAGAAKTIGKR